MTPPELAQFAMQDAAIATPAAAVRVLLEWGAKPGVRLLYTFAGKVRLFVIAILFAVIVGIIARAFPKAMDLLQLPLPVLLLATGFLGQDFGLRVLPWLQARLDALFATKKPRPSPRERDAKDTPQP